MKLQERLSVNATSLGTLERSALYKRVFGSPEGQKVLTDILNRLCNVDGPVFTTDAIGIAYNAARRDVGIEIARLYSMEVNEKKVPEVNK